MLRYVGKQGSAQQNGAFQAEGGRGVHPDLTLAAQSNNLPSSCSSSHMKARFQHVREEFVHGDERRFQTVVTRFAAYKRLNRHIIPMMSLTSQLELNL